MTDVFEEIVRVRARGEAAALATIVGVQGSAPAKEASHMLVGTGGILAGTIGGGCLEAEVFAEALEAIEEGKPRRISMRLTEREAGEGGLICGGVVEVFIEPLLVPAALIFGGGHVGSQVARAARSAGFKVTLVDDRPAFADPARLSEVDEVICGEYDEVFERLEIGESTYIVIVTRGHEYDRKVLERAAPSAARYVGMIGSRTRVAKTIRRVAASGVPAAALERVRAPIGLDIGAVTPGEIAVSIVAEMVAARRGADVGAVCMKHTTRTRRRREPARIRNLPAEKTGRDRSRTHEEH